MDKIKKYKEKARVVLIIYSNKDDIQTIKNSYLQNKKEIHKKWIKIVFYKKENKENKEKKEKKESNIDIFLIGFDGNIKKRYKKWDLNKIFNDVEKMENKDYVYSLKNKINFSLYEEYKPKSKIEGLGYKNKEKALFTIQKIQKMPIDYQKRTIITLKARAENHRHQTKDMINAISIFNKWLSNH